MRLGMKAFNKTFGYIKKFKWISRGERNFQQGNEIQCSYKVLELHWMVLQCSSHTMPFNT